MTRHVSYLSINFYVVNVLNIKWDTLAVSVAPVLTYLRIGRHHSPHWLVVRPALGQVTLSSVPAWETLFDICWDGQDGANQQFAVCFVM